MANVNLYKMDNLIAMRKKSLKINKPNIVYIDPPYNTSNKNMTYRDSFSYSEWNNFIKKRLERVKQISDDNSVFYISIGSEKVAELKIIADKCFGKNNFISLMPRITNKTSKTTNTISKINDWLLIYKKGVVEFIGEEMDDKNYKFKDEFFETRGKYQLRRLDYNNFNYSESLDYKIEFKGEEFWPNSHSGPLTNPKKKDWCWIWSEKKIIFGIKNDFIVVKNGCLWKKIYYKCSIKKRKDKYFIEYSNKRKPISSIHFLDKKFIPHNKDINKYFSYPKSIEFLKELIIQPKFKEKRLLDIFGGSGSAGLAAHSLGINSWICQIQEPIYNKGESNQEHVYVSDITETILKNIIGSQNLNIISN